MQIYFDYCAHGLLLVSFLKLNEKLSNVLEFCFLVLIINTHNTFIKLSS